MRLSGAAFWAICMLALAAQSSQAAIVTVTSSNLRVDTRDGGSLFVFGMDTSTALDRSNTITATAGSSSSSTTLNWSTTGSTYAKLSFDFEQTRGATENSYAQTYIDPLGFTVDADTTYSLSGAYELNGSQYISSATFLRDDTTDQYLFFDSNSSDTTLNEKFILGVANDGDSTNSTIGSLNGVLLAGHIYELYFDYNIYANTPNGEAASAVGSLTLEIGSAPTTAPVPEPATLTMWGLGALGCAAAAYRRKQKQAA